MKHFIPLIFLLFVSCKPEFPSIPADIIPMDEMMMILSDMHIADSVAETKAQTGANEKSLTAQYNEQVFKNHKITREEFLKSFKFYQDNPVLLNKIYDSILVELSRREAEIGK